MGTGAWSKLNVAKKTICTTRDSHWQELLLGISTNAVPLFVVVSDSEAIVEQEGREGETQPQLEFSLLRSAASLAVPRSKTAKLFWAGAVTGCRSTGCSAIPKAVLWEWISYLSATSTAELGYASKRDGELLSAGEGQWVLAAQGSAGTGESVTLAL